jgi:serine/threonine-protein kinase
VPGVPRDLETIALTCLRKNPVRRYASAGALADDLQRWLGGFPIRARPVSKLEHASRWCRRRPALASLLAVLAFTVASSLATLSAQNRALVLERTRAEDREQLAIDAVKRYGDVVRETPELKNEPGLASLRATLLKEPQTFFTRLRGRLQADRQTTPQSLARLAAANDYLGQLTNEIGDRQDALRAHEEALAIRQRLARRYPSNPDFQFALAESYHAIGFVQSEMGRPREARVAYEQARGLEERLARANPSVSRFQSKLAGTYLSIGNLELQEGRREDALKSHKQARTIWERLARANPSDTQLQTGLAKSYYSVGLMESSTGRPAEARASLEKALQIRERLARENPKDTQVQGDLADSLNIAANLIVDDDRPSEVMELRQRAQTIYERLVRANPSATRLQVSLANMLHNLGESHESLNQAAEAWESFERARTIWERLVREHPQSPSFAGSLGMTLGSVAKMELDQERFDKARATLQGAIVAERAALAANPDHPWYRLFLGERLSDMIRAAEGLGRDDEAERARHELDELRAKDPWNLQCDARLKAVLQGQAPKDDSERRALADLAERKALYAASARLLAETLAHKPKLTDESPDPNRYHAACEAALAGCGYGRDAPAEAERVKVRSQARAWLEAELEGYERWLNEPGDNSSRTKWRQSLNGWRQAPDLYGVRNPSALTRLPEAERAAWTALWGRVDGVLARMKNTRPSAVAP